MRISGVIYYAGLEEGRKDRPSVIVLAVATEPNGAIIVTVLPFTHTPPQDSEAGVEIPPLVKAHLGLDDRRSWVIVDEGNQFEWPGFDLKKVRATGRYEIGFVPPSLFQKIRDAYVSRDAAKKGGKLVPR